MDKIFLGVLFRSLIWGVVFLVTYNFLLKKNIIYRKIRTMIMVLLGIGIIFFNTYHLFTDSGIFLKDYYQDAPVGR